MRKSLLSAFGFLTSIRGSTSPSAKSASWFGLVGLMVGAFVGVVWVLGSRATTPILGAVLAVTADVFATYGLHYDGIADCGDGLFAHLSRDRRLEVMRQPVIGAFGAMALVLTIFLRIVALGSVEPSVWLLIGIFSISRSLMALSLAVFTYARAEGGMATAFDGSLSSWTDRVVWAVVLVVSVFIYLRCAGIYAGSVSLLLGLVAWFWFSKRGVRLLGGYTGDLVGGAGILFETVALVALRVAVAR